MFCLTGAAGAALPDVLVTNVRDAVAGTSASVAAGTPGNAGNGGTATMGACVTTGSAGAGSGAGVGSIIVTISVFVNLAAASGAQRQLQGGLLDPLVPGAAAAASYTPLQAKTAALLVSLLAVTNSAAPPPELAPWLAALGGTPAVAAAPGGVVVAVGGATAFTATVVTAALTAAAAGSIAGGGSAMPSPAAAAAAASAAGSGALIGGAAGAAVAIAVAALAVVLIKRRRTKAKAVTDHVRAPRTDADGTVVGSSNPFMRSALGAKEASFRAVGARRAQAQPSFRAVAATPVACNATVAAAPPNDTSDCGSDGGAVDGAAATGSPDLPPGWTEEYDAASGCRFYANNTTNETTWERPTA